MSSRLCWEILEFPQGQWGPGQQSPGMWSGNNFAHVERFAKFLGLSFVSRSTFCQAQRVYCIPAINEWWTWQQEIINHELQGQSLVVMGDGQCDSPRFTAKNLCYFLMEMTTGYIIDLEVLDNREVELKSVNMEKRALQLHT